MVSDVSGEEYVGKFVDNWESVGMGNGVILEKFLEICCRT